MVTYEEVSFARASAARHDRPWPGGARAAVAKAVEALADRHYEADAILLNSGDAAHAYVQGSDTGGFWVDSDTGARSFLGLPVVTTTAIAGGTAVVGNFRSSRLFVGDQFRIDVTTQAGDRFDKNLTGFRGEEGLAFNADPPVLAGAFQRITTIVP